MKNTFGRRRVPSSLIRLRGSGRRYSSGAVLAFGGLDLAGPNPPDQAQSRRGFTPPVLF